MGKCFSRTFSALFILSSIAHGAGTVVIVEGGAYAQKGDVYYSRPGVGRTLQVNEFGQYKDSKPIPVFVKWKQSTRRQLRPNDTIELGEIIQTTGEGFVKILFNDDSLLDIGPATAIQVEKFDVRAGKRDVSLKLAYGKVRSIVSTTLAVNERYQLLSPGALMKVRGTEFLVNVFSDQLGKSQTEVVCLHGQVSVDVAKHTTKGLVYLQPIVVNPSSRFVTEGVHGLGQNTQSIALSQLQLRDAVKKISPQVNVFATIVGAQPTLAHLPGTGIRMNRMVAQSALRPTVTKQNSFDLDHPPLNRVVAAPSENFELPIDFGNSPESFGRLPDLRRYTGPAPVALLPVGQ